MNLHEKLIDAITNLRILRVQYETIRNPPLMVEPHAYGLHEDVPSVFAWDRSYIDDHDWESGWMWLELDRILLADPTGGCFGGARYGYHHDMQSLRSIYAQI